MSWGTNFNFSIWHVALKGIDDAETIRPCVKWYQNVSEYFLVFAKLPLDNFVIGLVIIFGSTSLPPSPNIPSLPSSVTLSLSLPPVSLSFYFTISFSVSIFLSDFLVFDIETYAIVWALTM